MNMNKLSLMSAVLFSAAFTAASHAQTTTTIVNDSFPILESELGADYFGTSGTNAIEIVDDGATPPTITAIGNVTGTSGRQMHAIFDTVTLEEAGDSIQATLRFQTPPTTAQNTNDDMRFGIFDNLGRAGLSANLGAGSNGNEEPLLVGLPGIVVELDVEPVGDTDTRNINIRQSDPSLSGRLLGTNDGVDNVSSGGALDYQFAANTVYEVEMTIERVANGGDPDQQLTTIVFSEVDAQGALIELGTHSDTLDATGSAQTNANSVFMDDPATDDDEVLAIPVDVDPTLSYSYGMMSLGASTNAFGSTTSSGSNDNGLEIVSFVVDFTDADGVVGGGGEPTEPTEPTEPADEACYTLPTQSGGVAVFCL